MGLDLSKLKALELPSKEITINIAGQEQSVTVKALNDETSIQVALLGEKKEDADTLLKIHRTVLLNGIDGISAEDVDVLCQKAMPVAMSLVSSIRDLTVEFAKQRESVSAEAKKN
jgi:hypothetical protein